MEETPKRGEESDSKPHERRQGEHAVFLGWQRTPFGKVFALYNVTAESHPLHGSTVTEPTLRQHNLPVPQTPPPESSGESLKGQTNSDRPGKYR